MDTSSVAGSSMLKADGNKNVLLTATGGEGAINGLEIVNDRFVFILLHQ